MKNIHLKVYLIYDVIYIIVYFITVKKLWNANKRNNIILFLSFLKNNDEIFFIFLLEKS
jgi:hypothetical protein